MTSITRSDTSPPGDTTSQRDVDFADAIDAANLRAAALTRLSRHDVDAPLYGTTWAYQPVPGLTDDEQIAAARDWLTRHRHAFLAVARALGDSGPAKKVENDRTIGVQVDLGRRNPFGSSLVRLDAEVPAEATCEMVDTGKTRTIPAQPERVEPVLERRCPPSIFRGIDTDRDRLDGLVDDSEVA